MPIKKATKKVSSKAKALKTPTELVNESESVINSPKYNEYGVCIDCQGGDPECRHNNLSVHNGKTYCVLCGIQV